MHIYRAPYMPIEGYRGANEGPQHIATVPNFRKSLSKCRFFSPKNSYLSISVVSKQQQLAATAIDR